LQFLFIFWNFFLVVGYFFLNHPVFHRPHIFIFKLRIPLRHPKYFFSPTEWRWH